MFRLRRARYLTRSLPHYLRHSHVSDRIFFVRFPATLSALLPPSGLAGKVGSAWTYLSGDSRPGPDGLCSMRLYQGHSNLDTIANYTATRLRLLDSRHLLVLSRPRTSVEGLLRIRRLEAGNPRDSSLYLSCCRLGYNTISPSLGFDPQPLYGCLEEVLLPFFLLPLR
jgi:hypothetical protein